MLLCILEEDVGYWLTLKSVWPGSETIDRKEEQRGSYFFQVVLWERSARSAGPGRAVLWRRVYLICKKNKSLIFHLGIRIQNVLNARRNAIQSGSAFSKTEERGIGFQTEKFHAVFLLKGWEEAIWCVCWVKEEQSLYPWRIHYVTVPVKVSAVLFSAGKLRT